MIAKEETLRLAPGTLGKLTFVTELEPLPLIDPSEAAHFLKIKRHSLACYRSLEEGPPYYKFGRWIRYAKADLQAWRDGARATALHPLGQVESNDAKLVATSTAARYLSVTPSCLRNYRIEGIGPRFCRLGRRLHYPVHELKRWAESQRQSG